VGLTAEGSLERIADGRTDMVFVHVAQGRPATAGVGGLRLLEWCAYYGDVSVMRFLLDHGELLPSLGANLGLNGAAFLAHGADVDRSTRPSVKTGCFMRDCRTKGETPLHRAAAFGTEGTIERLLAAGARVDARDMNGETPLGWASWHGRPDAVLRRLCYGEHSIHPDRKPMPASLLGWPRGGS